MKIILLIHLSFLVNYQLIGQGKTGYLTNDGAWCWFSDPRAIISDNVIITGWVNSRGTIEAAKFDVESQSILPYELYYRLEKDDHDNPAFAFIPPRHVIAMYTRHGKKDLFINHLMDYQNDEAFTGAQLIHPISKKELENFPRETVTYANPVPLRNEDNRLYCFGRWTGYKPNMMWSDDGGFTWSKSKVFITNFPFDPDNRPYVKYYSDGESKIHIVFTDGHPRNEPTNSVYYVYYEKGAFYKASGKKICDVKHLPFEPGDASVVYDSNIEEGRAWIADIAQDKQHNPVILFTKSPTETNHEYWYSRYINNKWVNIKLCDSGKWFPQTPEGEIEKEPHYFGGMTMHPSNANVVYLSRQNNKVFEIERWETSNMGKTWEKEAITENSLNDNVRPFIPRGLTEDSPEVLLWMENQKYVHYTDFETAIKFFIRDK